MLRENLTVQAVVDATLDLLGAAVRRCAVADRTSLLVWQEGRSRCGRDGEDGKDVHDARVSDGLWFKVSGGSEITTLVGCTGVEGRGRKGTLCDLKYLAPSASNSLKPTSNRPNSCHIGKLYR